MTLSPTLKHFIFVFCFLLATITHAQHRFTVSPIQSIAGERPAPRTDHSTVVVNTFDGYFLLVHGGRNSHGSLNDTWTYEVASKKWEPLAPLNEGLPNDPPPPMYGSIGGYRFVEGYNGAFLYVTMGTNDGATQFYNDMWAMELTNFTWRKVALDGDVPSARYSAAGGLERFVKKFDEVRAEFIISHGFGENGPLSDTYRCQFNRTNPYHATWRRIHIPVSQYSLQGPHPMYLQGASFTANRDLIMFGGCYSSRTSGGYCPSNAAWILETQDDDDDGYKYDWRRLSTEPPARVGAAMAQALSSFKGAYEQWIEMAVVYSGSQNTDIYNSRQKLLVTPVNNAEIALYTSDTYSPLLSKWIREVVAYAGPPELKQEVLAGRRGATLSIVRDVNEGSDPDVPDEYYLLLGGQLENGSFTDAILKVSFDPFALPKTSDGAAKLWTRPQLHGVLMFVSYGILNPAGAFIHRYFREKRKNEHLFAANILMQCIACTLGWVALGIANYGRWHKRAEFAHAYIGYMVIVLSTLHPLYAIIEMAVRWRVDKWKMDASEENPGFTPNPSSNKFWLVSALLRRSCGYLVTCSGFMNITLGVLLLTSPLLLWVHWAVYVIVICIITFWMEMTVSKPLSTSYDATGPLSFEPGSIFSNSVTRSIFRHPPSRSPVTASSKRERDKINGQPV